MPITITGDATKRIEALVVGLSDDNMRALTVELRDSLVRRLWNVQWKGGPSVYIGRGLTSYTEPVRTPTGGWMCGVGSLDILHRDDAPPKTITQFLYWYQTQYIPAEKERRRAEKTKAQAAAEKAGAKARIEALQRKRVESGRKRLDHIYDVSIPHQRNLLDSASRRIAKLDQAISSAAAARLTKSVQRLKELRQEWIKRRDKRREMINKLNFEIAQIERTLSGSK